MKFEYIIELKKDMPWNPVNQEPTNEIRIQIEANCRVTADRAMKAICWHNPTIVSYSGIN